MNLADNGWDPVAGFRGHKNLTSGSIHGRWVGGKYTPFELLSPSHDAICSVELSSLMLKEYVGH